MSDRKRRKSDTHDMFGTLVIYTHQDGKKTYESHTDHKTAVKFAQSFLGAVGQGISVEIKSCICIDRKI